MTADLNNDRTPFGGTPRARTTWAGAAIFGVLAIATVLVARRYTTATQSAATPAAKDTSSMPGMPGMSTHDHAAMSQDAAKVVMLTPDQQRRIGVTYAPVVDGPLSIEVRTVAQVVADETRITTISPKLDGWIRQLAVNFTGQSVREGEPLFTLYSPMFVTAASELALAAKLTRDVAGGSAEARTTAANVLDAARRRLSNWDVPREEVDRIERTGEAPNDLTLRSPVSGVVVEKNVVAGQKTMTGESLYRIADLSTVWVEGEVFERDLAVVHTGQPVRIEFAALPGTAREGRIAYLYPTVNAATRTARIRVVLQNPGLTLKPGMYATILIRSDAAGHALSVPRSAVLSTGERHLVFVRRPDGMLEPREVLLGVAADDRLAILAGVKRGETVVASATFLVDAESNLATLMGGMGNMPGMDMTAPAKPKP